MNKAEEITDGLLVEMRRGIIVFSVLSQLEKPQYGYSLLQRLENKGVSVDAGTLYPLLRRLEKQELLKSEWETTGAKPRKYYVLNELGAEVYTRLCGAWTEMVENLDKLINMKGEEPNGDD